MTYTVTLLSFICAVYYLFPLSILLPSASSLVGAPFVLSTSFNNTIYTKATEQ